jgi:nucleotide-binding universal stress UspA family protein
METIFIATDFSSAARNATRYGFELAKSMRAKVILFTAYQQVVAMPNSLPYETDEELERNSYQRLFEEAEAIDPRKTVALETRTMKGPVNSSILSAAIETNASFIVIGMKESGKEIRKYFGSTVTDLCKRALIPLIVVPLEAEFAIPKIIALASDISHETDIHILEPLKQIAEKYKSAVHIVRVIKKGMDEGLERATRSERLNWLLQDVEVCYDFINGENVAKAMNNFVVKNAVDMVAAIPHEHTLLERLFTKSVTKDLVFHTHVPLLVLPATKKVSEAEPAKNSYSSEYFYGVC